ncbi:MAG: hypothetical protein U5N53_12470 [Mycobacterium sp.]|nr:hypothetical protein [Mycobacterium sp.]
MLRLPRRQPKAPQELDVVARRSSPPEKALPEALVTPVMAVASVQIACGVSSIRVCRLLELWSAQPPVLDAVQSAARPSASSVRTFPTSSAHMAFSTSSSSARAAVDLIARLLPGKSRCCKLLLAATVELSRRARRSVVTLPATAGRAPAEQVISFRRALFGRHQASLKARF